MHPLKPWTEEETARLIQIVAEQPWTAAARELKRSVKSIVGKIRDLRVHGVAVPTCSYGKPHNLRKLTPEEIEWIRNNARTMNRTQMAAHLGISLTNLYKKLHEHAAADIHSCFWTAADEEQLRGMAGRVSTGEIAEKLGRTRNSVRNRAKQLHISVAIRGRWRQDETDTACAMAREGKPLPEIAAQLGRCQEMVRRALKASGVQARRVNASTRLRGHLSNEEKERIRALRGEGLRVAEIAAQLGCSERAVCRTLRITSRLVQSTSGQQAPAPRERKGIPPPQRRREVKGTVAWCGYCHAPVVDTPDGWFQHNLRVHTASVAATAAHQSPLRAPVERVA